MTAINILNLPASVHLFTDTRMSLGGVLMGQAVKCLPLPHLWAAVATRGDSAVLAIIHRVASQMTSYESMKRDIIAAMRDLTDQTALVPDARVPVGLARPWDAFFIGWGDAGPDAFAFFSHGGHGIPAWRHHEISGTLVTPVLPQAICEDILQLGNPISAGMAILDLQHEIYPEAVGGQMIETWVDSAGVHTRRLKDIQAPAPKPAHREVRLPAVFAKYQTGREPV